MKQAERVAATRAKLVDAVFALRDRDPAAPLTVTAVCREADVAKPTFYQYFRSVDALVAEACGELLEQRIGEIPGDVPPDELRGYLGGLLERDQRIFEAVRESGPETRERVVVTVAGRVADWYRDSPEGAVVPGETVQLRARFAAAGALSLVLARLDGELGDIASGRLVDEISDLVAATMSA